MIETTSFSGKNIAAMMAHAEGNRSNAGRDTLIESRNDSIDGARAKRKPKSPSPPSHRYESSTEHKYHDYANVTELPMQLASQSENRGLGGVCNPFPVVLYTLLSEASLFGFSDIISWQPHGRSFLIHRSKEFVRDIVPKYFKHSKLASFQRQLSLYGFTRMCQESPDRGSYFHEVSIFHAPRVFFVAALDIFSLFCPTALSPWSLLSLHQNP